MQNILNSFIKNEITIFEAIKLLYDNNLKKEQGSVYTSNEISTYMIKQLNFNLHNTFIEPAVGHGVFVFSLLEYIKDKLKPKPEIFLNFIFNNIYCFDIDSNKILEFKILLETYIIKYLNENNLPFFNFIFNNIHCTDSLFFHKHIKYDFCIGNPPYIRTRNIESNYLKKIREKFNTCKTGNIDIYYAFIEQAVLNSKETIFIIPNSYIVNSSANNLRVAIKDKVYSIIDFKDKQMFSDATTYTTILHLKDKQYDNFLYSNNFNEKPLELNREILNNNVWNFKKNNNHENTLKDYFNVKSGIETLRNNLFIIEETKIYNIKNKEYYIKSYENETFYIEKEITTNLFKISTNKNYVIINPYDKDLSLIEENLIKENYPNAYLYLNKIKETLLKRDNGKAVNYEKWYAYGRKQGLSINNHKYYIFIPKMISKSFEAKIYEIKGHFLFLSGFIIPSNNKEDLLKLKENIDRNFFYYISNIEKCWNGGFYSVSTKSIKNFPI